MSHTTHRPGLTALGVVLALPGLLLLAIGIGLLWVHLTQRDDDGFVTSPTHEVVGQGHAITSEEVRLMSGAGDWLPTPGQLTVRVRVTPLDDERAIFVGIADRAAVATYLQDVDRDTVTGLGPAGTAAEVEEVAGIAVPAPPAAQPFWAASRSGTGAQTLTVAPQVGDWTLVVMNADGSAGVAVDATVAVASTLLLPTGAALAAGGVLLLAAASLLLLFGAGRDQAGPSLPTPGQVHPVRLEAHLDQPLSRGLWLIKWALVIPHLLVLMVLWACFVVLTVVAGVAILVRGRYPQRILAFNVGVMRWTWRVSHYAYGTLGTDRYPPFSLAPDPTYPASLEVADPGRLSRGKVLVKWWLLVLPHYLVVGLFTGGALSRTVQVGPDGGQVVLGGGLIGVLVLIAGVTLLVRGRHPQGLFDLLVGLHRWVYRVIAYAALMTDTYPPFRLDAGGEEPSPHPTPPTTPTPDEGASHDLASA